ncbi:hypothetical protein KPL78_02035 [Roseomonas sp. HJA6]|uniref:Oxidoreductase molybdopterin-binding domain-containing protein n=1 Tax=Roseomonas alba TaxID=2846776 RepID=A0ABS7A2U5_9PROT|nr:molybdopterin-dependent oxidoreductase [Neoroseomonas alba]MBW6396603.1 hypothetical protein [Neoroseomonas alba]
MSIARRVLLSGFGFPLAAAAGDLAVLQVAGSIAPPSPRLLDLAALDAIGLEPLVTRTPWTQGPQHFSGVTLARLLASLGAFGDTLRVVALNDYAAAMPIAEVLASDGFLATRQDGEPIPIRNRGPFWILFPWSERPELFTRIHRQRAVWQVKRLEIA